MNTTEKDLLGRELPKWPGLQVVGKPIGKERAMEILIRTDDLGISTNARYFEKKANKLIYGIEEAEMNIVESLATTNNVSTVEALRMKEAMLAKYGLLDNVHYLRNRQIASCWIGGPHGWCNWSGQIFCNTYNIGKYPSCAEVYFEWLNIAANFSFLDLRCQLFDRESCEDGALPVIEFIVKDGAVQVVDPKEPLTTWQDVLFAFGVRGEDGEVGISLSGLEAALEHARVMTRLRPTINVEAPEGISW